MSDSPPTLESVLYAIDVAPTIASLVVCVEFVRVATGPYVRLIWCSQALQDLTQGCSSRSTSQADIGTQRSFLASQGSTRASLLSSNRDMQPSCSLLVKSAAVSLAGIPAASITRNEERANWRRPTRGFDKCRQLGRILPLAAYCKHIKTKRHIYKSCA
jgi:hypothetical protein